MKQIFKLFTFADIVLIAILLTAALLLLWNMKSQLQKKKIEIHYHNSLVGQYDLSIDKIIELGEDAVVEIAHGKVRLKLSSCKKQYCVQQGWSNGIPIICVPNEIAISFISKKEEMLITR